MKIIPIKDFENDYAITDQGTVIDLYDNSVKVAYALNYFKHSQSSVDLYKDGELVLTISIKELVLRHFFNCGLNVKQITFIDGNDKNFSPYNMIVEKYPYSYVNNLGMTKPVEILGYNQNGLHVLNQDQIDEYDRIHNEKMEEIKQLKAIERKEKSLKNRKIPLPGTPERVAHDKMMEERRAELGRIQSVHVKLKRYKDFAEKFGLPFDVTYEDVVELHEKQNGKCAISDEEFLPGGSFKFLINDLDEGIVKGNIQLGKYGPTIRRLIEFMNTKPKKEKVITFKVTNDQYNEIKDLAIKTGSTVSKIILEKVFQNS